MKLSELNLLSVGHTINLVGAVYSGEGKMLLALFPEDQGEIKTRDGEAPAFFQETSGVSIETLEMDTADWERFLRQTDLLETEVLTKASDGTLAKAILRKSQRQIDTNVQWKVWRRDKFSCVYCGKDDVPLTVDHLVTWEVGGPSVEANLVTADRPCNKARGNLSYADWLRHPHYLKVSRISRQRGDRPTRPFLPP